MIKVDDLRNRLSQLLKDRETIIFEKGLAADENKDLRENWAYDYWDRKEHNITSQILEITKEIQVLQIQQKGKGRFLKSNFKQPSQ